MENWQIRCIFHLILTNCSYFSRQIAISSWRNYARLTGRDVKKSQPPRTMAVRLFARIFSSVPRASFGKEPNSLCYLAVIRGCLARQCTMRSRKPRRYPSDRLGRWRWAVGREARREPLGREALPFRPSVGAYVLAPSEFEARVNLYSSRISDTRPGAFKALSRGHLSSLEEGWKGFPRAHCWHISRAFTALVHTQPAKLGYFCLLFSAFV